MTFKRSTQGATNAPRFGVPMPGCQEWDTSTPETAQSSAMAVLQREQDRLFKFAWRIVRTIQDADDALSELSIYMLAARANDADHCRALAYTILRQCCLRIVGKRKHADVPIEEFFEHAPSQHRVESQAIAWIMAQCDKTECRVLEIYLKQGDVRDVVSDTRGWLKPWSQQEFSRLMARIREHAGVALAAPRMLRETSTSAELYGPGLTSDATRWNLWDLVACDPEAIATDKQVRVAMPRVFEQDRAWREVTPRWRLRGWLSDVSECGCAWVLEEEAIPGNGFPRLATEKPASTLRAINVSEFITPHSQGLAPSFSRVDRRKDQLAGIRLFEQWQQEETKC